jgi:hypothetical protein
MSEYYYGKFGKDNSYGLLANKRLVLWSKTKEGLMAFDSIAEADQHFNPPDDHIYFWENGEWKEVNFLVEGDGHKVVKGFAP